MHPVACEEEGLAGVAGAWREGGKDRGMVGRSGRRWDEHSRCLELCLFKKLWWERGHRWGEARGQRQVCPGGGAGACWGLSGSGQLQENHPQGSFLPRMLFCFHAASGKQSDHGVSHLGARPAKSSEKASRTAQSEGPLDGQDGSQTPCGQVGWQCSVVSTWPQLRC